jgi:NAD/NADP transhydrogenase alpha subunit
LGATVVSDRSAKAPELTRAGSIVGSDAAGKGGACVVTPCDVITEYHALKIVTEAEPALGSTM